MNEDIIIIFLLIAIILPVLVIYSLRKLGITNKKKETVDTSVSEKIKLQNILVDKGDDMNENISDQKKTIEPNDYPVMAFVGRFFNVVAIFNAASGVIFAVVQLVDGNLYSSFIGLVFGAITWAFAKFASESTKILSDIANSLKVIRINSDSWKS